MNRIKQLREQKKLKRNELANLINAKASSVSEWEKGSYKPSETQMLKLCEFFNCTPDYLMGYSDINLKDNNSNKNKITLIGRNGIVEEYILSDEEMNAYQAIFKNREKYKNNNDSNS